MKERRRDPWQLWESMPCPALSGLPTVPTWDQARHLQRLLVPSTSDHIWCSSNCSFHQAGIRTVAGMLLALKDVQEGSSKFLAAGPTPDSSHGRSKPGTRPQGCLGSKVVQAQQLFLAQQSFQPCPSGQFSCFVKGNPEADIKRGRMMLAMAAEGLVMPLKCSRHGNLINTATKHLSPG